MPPSTSKSNANPTSQTLAIQHQLVAVAGELSPALAQVIAHNGPLTLTPKQDTPFAQRLCRAVAGQQLSVKAARSIWGRVLEQVPVDTVMVDYLSDVAPDILKGCGLSGAKVRTLGEIAQAAQAGKLDAAKLGKLTHTERTQHLTALWGIGQWTADMMGIFYFGDTDIWPDGDVTARKTLEKLTSKRRKTTRTAARFAPHRSYLALHMWQHADAAPS